MKKHILPFFTLLALVAILMPACKEKMILIPDVTVGKKRVLAEELTGVRCPNCPDGTKELVRLDSAFGENLIVISNHSAGSFSIPLTTPLSAYDFRDQTFKDLAAKIGTHRRLPNGFNRSCKTWLKPFCVFAYPS